MPHPLRTVARRALAPVALLALVTASATAQCGKLTRNDLLVTSDWLATQLDNPKLVPLHVGDKEGYDAEHIPGAQFLQIMTVAAKQTESEATQLALELPPIDELRQRLQTLGISDDSRIVVYYGKDWVSPSTRVMLTLQYAGLGARSSLLDGGLPAW